MTTREFVLLYMLMINPQVFSGMEDSVKEYLYRNETRSFFLTRAKYESCGTSQVQQMMKETPVQHAPYFDRTQVTLGEITGGDKNRKVRPLVASIHIRPYVTRSRAKSAKRGQRTRLEPFYGFENTTGLDDFEITEYDILMSRRESLKRFNEAYPEMTLEEKLKRPDLPEEIARRQGLPTNPPTKRRVAAVEKIFNDPYLSDEEKLDMAEVAVKHPSGSLWTDSYAGKKTSVKRKEWVEELD